MARQARILAWTATALLFSSLFVGLASGASHYPLSVVLSHDSADGTPTGGNFTAWATVFVRDVPTNASNVTFRFGLDLPPIAPMVNFTGLYAGSPGLYRATINLTSWDTSFGLSFLAVTARLGNDTATNARTVITNSSQLFGGPPGPAATNWTVTAGVANHPALGPKLDPGETVVWRIETRSNGVLTAAPSLTADLFIAPHVEFTETPLPLSPTAAGTGVYLVNYTVPLNWTVGQELVLQATVDESEWIQTNTTDALWFYDTVAQLTQITGTRVTGALTVGDGTSVVQGLAVNIVLEETGNPSHVIGSITGTTNASGGVSFDLPNDGTTSLSAVGWINGSRSEPIHKDLRADTPYSPPSPSGAPLDAIALQDISALPWAGIQSLSFEFYSNGSLWANQPVLAFVSSARGLYTFVNLTTDAQGRATFAVNFSQRAFTFDDLYNNLNFTFRSVIGPDSRSSDGNFWAEAENHYLPNFIVNYIKTLVDTNLSFLSTAMTLGTPFGFGAKYTGPRNVTGYEGAAIAVPGGIEALFDQGPTPTHSVWTASSDGWPTYLVDGDGKEYYGAVSIPSYWPNTTYTFLAIVAPNLGVIGGEQGPLGQIINWVELTPGGSAGEFTPTADTRPPLLFGPSDMTVEIGTTLTLETYAYDNSLDFFSAANFSWLVSAPVTTDTLYGNGANYTFAYVGDHPILLNVTDGTGHSTTHLFTVAAVDTAPPSATAPPDFTVAAGEVAYFNGTSTDNDPLYSVGGSSNWTFLYNGSLVTLPGPNATYVFWSVGTYNLTFTASDGSGNFANDWLEITVVTPDTTPPSVALGGDRTVAAGVAVTLDGNATDDDPLFPAGGSSWWNFTYNGTAQNLTGTNVSFTFWTLGNYVLTFTAVDAWGNRASGSITVTVVRPDTTPPVANAGADDNVTTGTQVFLNGSATDNDPLFGSNALYWWTFTYSGSPRNLSGRNTSFVFSVPGTYLVTLWVRDGWGNQGSDTRTVLVRVPDTVAPIVQPITDKAINAGTSLQVVAQASDNSLDFATTGNYTWSFTYNNATVTQYGPTFTFLFDLQGNYNVTLTVRDGSGNAAAPRTFVVRVVIPDTTPPVILSAGADKTSVTAGETVRFSASAADGGVNITDPASFKWSFTYNGSGYNLSGSSATFKFDVAGTYRVTLTATDAAGNHANQSFDVTVAEKPSTPVSPAGPGLELAVLILAVVAAVVGVTYLVGRRHKPKAPAADTEDEEP